MATNVFLSNPFCSHPYASNVFTGVKVPVPPFVPTKKKAKAAVGGGSFLSPTEPLDYATGCPPWKPPKDILEKVFSKSKNKRTAPDPLEVLRDVKKTEERVKKSELRALRIRISKLQRESEGLTVSHQNELHEAFNKIRELEHRVVCVQQDLVRIENWYQAKLKWQPYAFLPRWQPTQAKVESLHTAPETQALVESSEEGRSWMAIKSALPYVGVSGAVTLATIYFIPDDKRALKFVGYGSAMAVFLFGVNVALDVLLEPYRPAAPATLKKPDVA